MVMGSRVSLLVLTAKEEGDHGQGGDADKEVANDVIVGGQGVG